jgi:hypothetical protein
MAAFFVVFVAKIFFLLQCHSAEIGDVEEIMI